MHLVGRQDYTLAKETTTWLKRTDVYISTSTDGTVHSVGRYAGKIYLRSKQELLKWEKFGWL